MKEKYKIINNLSVSESLLNFVNNELLTGTKIKKENFWKGFDKYVHELAHKNKELLEIRKKLQNKIDDWHKDRRGEKFDVKKYTKFLKKNWLFKKNWSKFQNQNKKFGY